MQRIQVVQETAAPVATVWGILADVEHWSSWGPWEESTIERPGSPEPAGVGSIRRLRVGRRVLREQTTVFEPGQAMAYTVLSGIPVRGYEGRAVLEDHDGVTRITWTSVFDGAPRLLGPLIKRGLEPRIADVVMRLVHAAEERHRAEGPTH